MVRDVYAFFPLLMKYTDLHRAKWLKSPTWESDGVYENVAVIFKIWSLSQHFKREELNYMAQFEDDSAFGGEMKTGKAAIAERKKRRRETAVCLFEIFIWFLGEKGQTFEQHCYRLFEEVVACGVECIRRKGVGHRPTVQRKVLGQRERGKDSRVHSGPVGCSCKSEFILLSQWVLDRSDGQKRLATQPLSENWKVSNERQRRDDPGRRHRENR